jgi:hypothetical protein
MDLQIGFANGILRGNEHTEYFYGMIDDVRLYSRVRRGEIRGARHPRPCHSPWRHSIPEALPPIGNRPTFIGGRGLPSPTEQRAGAHPRAAHAPQSEKDRKLAHKLDQLQACMAVFRQECMGQLASSGPT